MTDELAADLQAAREQVASGARKLAAAGLVHGTAGNVSQRAGELIAVTATGAELSTISAEQVSVVDSNGALVTGELEPTSELGLHLGVYERYGAGAGAVVHTHAPMGVALSCVLDELPCVHYQMLAFGGAVRVAPYYTFGSPELAAATLTALEGKRAALMANHGMIAYGTDLRDAIANTEILEWASTIYWHAAAIGTPRVMGEADLAAVVETIVNSGYGNTRRHEG